MSEVAKRYARAAVELASEAGGDGAVRTLADSLDGIAHAFANSEELRAVLRHPGRRDASTKVLKALLDKIGASEDAHRFVRFVLEKDRIELLPDIASAIRELANDRVGSVLATIDSAVQLDAQQVERLKKAIETRMGRKAEVTVRVLPTLLGGLVCRIGDLTIDTSVRRQLESMRAQLEADL